MKMMYEQDKSVEKEWMIRGQGYREVRYEIGSKIESMSRKLDEKAKKL